MGYTTIPTGYIAGFLPTINSITRFLQGSPLWVHPRPVPKDPRSAGSTSSWGTSIVAPLDADLGPQQFFLEGSNKNWSRIWHASIYRFVGNTNLNNNTWATGKMQYNKTRSCEGRYLHRFWEFAVSVYMDLVCHAVTFACWFGFKPWGWGWLVVSLQKRCASFRIVGKRIFS